MAREYDLKERTLKYAEDVIDFCGSIRVTIVTKPLMSQFIRSGTSVGANYCEATNASSKKDFRNKIFICKKEAEESKYWIKLLAKASPDAADRAKSIARETQELLLIFQKIILSTKES